MFTGIIDHCGKIEQITPTETGLRLQISCQFQALQLGESIAVDGVCLTVTDCHPNGFSCDLSPETCQLTRFGQISEAELVNLERALRLGDRLGGHWVSGHVDQVAVLAEQQLQGEFVYLRFAGLSPTALQYLIKKGSIAVNGVSLTINAVLADGFAVMLIPHTLSLTNLAYLEVGSQVNLEFDMIAKMVAKQVQPYLPSQD